MAPNGKQPYKHKPNRGSMFENDRKQRETQPDFVGTIDVQGVVFWIHGWKAMTQNGKKRISLSVQVQEERQPDTHGGDEEGWGGALPRKSPPPQRKQSSW